MNVAWLLVVEVTAGDGCCGVVAHRQPDLGHRRQGEVVGCAGSTHLGRHPAGLEGVGEHAGPAAGNREGQDDVEELAVCVGLGPVPTASGPLEVVEVGVATFVHS